MRARRREKAAPPVRLVRVLEELQELAIARGPELTCDLQRCLAVDRPGVRIRTMLA